jgi:hypothetical protein
MTGSGLDESGSGQGKVVGCCEDGSEHLMFHKIRGISWPTEEHLEPQGLCATKVVGELASVAAARPGRVDRTTLWLAAALDSAGTRIPTCVWWLWQAVPKVLILCFADVRLSYTLVTYSWKLLLARDADLYNIYTNAFVQFFVTVLQ